MMSKYEWIVLILLFLDFLQKKKTTKTYWWWHGTTSSLQLEDVINNTFIFFLSYITQWSEKNFDFGRLKQFWSMVGRKLILETTSISRMKQFKLEQEIAFWFFWYFVHSKYFLWQLSKNLTMLEYQSFCWIFFH